MAFPSLSISLSFFALYILFLVFQYGKEIKKVDKTQNTVLLFLQSKLDAQNVYCSNIRLFRSKKYRSTF